MPTTLTQSDLDTLYTAASQNASVATGPYNEIGTSTGEFVIGTLSTDFEKNIATLIALTEFTVAAGADPSSLQLGAKRQRKMLKELLIKVSAKVKAASSSASDDRASVASTVTTVAIRQFNTNNRPDASNSNT